MLSEPPLKWLVSFDISHIDYYSLRDLARSGPIRVIIFYTIFTELLN